jgi:hypothetical protein
MRDDIQQAPDLLLLKINASPQPVNFLVELKPRWLFPPVGQGHLTHAFTSLPSLSRRSLLAS